MAFEMWFYVNCWSEKEKEREKIIEKNSCTGIEERLEFYFLLYKVLPFSLWREYYSCIILVLQIYYELLSVTESRARGNFFCWTSFVTLGKPHWSRFLREKGTRCIPLVNSLSEIIMVWMLTNEWWNKEEETNKQRKVIHSYLVSALW
jgi:hypothetical protein